MDRGVLHKSSALVGEMGEGHGWWSVNNLRPPFEQQHNPSSSLLFLPSTTATATAPSSPHLHLHSFSSLLLSNHYPLPTTAAATTPWQHDDAAAGGGQLHDPWSHHFIGGLANGNEERYKSSWPEGGQVLFPSAGGGGGGAAAGEVDGSSSYIYSTTTTSCHGSSTSDDIPLPPARSSSSPWGGGGGVHQHHHNTDGGLQQASSPRSSTCISPTASLGSNMLEFSNNSSPRESISTASGAAFKKARTQEHSPAHSIVKVRKEKLGDRITALHQLVSPFGKTDTASVLLEAIGYIRFLHGQIEALSSPYLGGNGGGGGGSSSSRQQQQHQQQHEGSVQVQQGERNSIFPEDPGQLLHDNAMKKRGQTEQNGSCEEAAKTDLRSRGLCLVPVSCTLDIGADAGPADYWAAPPAFGMGFGR